MSPAFGRCVKPITTSYNVFWSAYFTDEYCGCGTCHPLIGHGKTEAEAVANLLEQEEEATAC